MIVKKVWENKTNGQKLVTIPKESDIDPGDYVKIDKVENQEEEEG